MIALNSEDDLWQLFGGEGPEAQGVTELYYTYFFKKTSCLDVGKIKGFRPRFAVSDTEHFYLLRSPDIEAVVDQARLYVTAREIGGPDLRVAYLGKALKTGHHASVPAKVQRVARTPAKAVPAASTSSSKRDTLDKIVESYFATLTAERFWYKGKEYLPRDVYVSPGIVRDYTCPEGCGGCCPRFSLDYIATDSLPIGEKHPLTSRMIEFNGRHVEVWSDMQTDHHNPKCRNLNLNNGRCGIHGFQPFSCDFELLRSVMSKDSPRAMFTQKLYGRGWAMMRVDGKRGALCEMLPSDAAAIADVDRRLARLELWMTHFGLNPKRVAYIRQHLGQIAETGKPLRIPKGTLLA